MVCALGGSHLREPGHSKGRRSSAGWGPSWWRNGANRTALTWLVSTMEIAIQIEIRWNSISVQSQQPRFGDQLSHDVTGTVFQIPQATDFVLRERVFHPFRLHKCQSGSLPHFHLKYVKWWWIIHTHTHTHTHTHPTGTPHTHIHHRHTHSAHTHTHTPHTQMGLFYSFCSITGFIQTWLDSQHT